MIIVLYMSHVLDLPFFALISVVYHLLSAKQLEQWDEAEQEFYNEEITYQVFAVERCVYTYVVNGMIIMVYM